jgi:uncharacterized protein (DUF1330 family)
MSTLKTTVVVEGLFKQGFEEHFAEYSRKVRAYLERHGGQVIRRQRVRRVLIGDTGPDLIMLIDFPSDAVAERIFFAPEYLALVPLRNRVFAEFRMYLAEYGDI